LAFPIDRFHGAEVVAFAAARGHTILDANALAVETKSSWVDAAVVRNPQDYVQVSAVVPTFNRNNPYDWIPNGESTVKLVMVGMHVVGSVNDHPELIWATFEHLGNAPNATYAYNSTSGLRTVTQDTTGTWVFTPSGSPGPFNVPNASVMAAAIASTLPGIPIGPVSVLRAKPWGSNDGGNPADAAGLNTEVISANFSVIRELNVADVRRNYFQVGATWKAAGREVGTNHLANATMETFEQGATPSDPSMNCLSCHQTETVSVSHVYADLKPLP
jgi:hypothetical protein